MSRARGGADPSTSGPSCRRPNLSTENIERIERQLNALPRDYDGLLLAMQAFAPDFSFAKFRVAHDSLAGKEHNPAKLVTSNFRDLVDNFVELLSYTTTAAGLRPPRRQLNANLDIEALRDDGAFTSQQAHDIIELKKVANRLRHTYVLVDAETVHSSVTTLLTILPPFVASYTQWLEKYDVQLSHGPAQFGPPTKSP